MLLFIVLSNKQFYEVFCKDFAIMHSSIVSLFLMLQSFFSPPEPASMIFFLAVAFAMLFKIFSSFLLFSAYAETACRLHVHQFYSNKFNTHIFPRVVILLLP